MGVLEIFEWILILGIIVLQVRVFLSTKRQIAQMGCFLTNQEHLRLRTKKADDDDTDDAEDLQDSVYNELSAHKLIGHVCQSQALQNTAWLKTGCYIHKGDKVTFKSVIYGERTGTITNLYVDDNQVDCVGTGETVKIVFDCVVFASDDIYRRAALVSINKIPSKANAAVSVITLHKDEQNPLLRSVIKTINNYLDKNKGAATDFHLIKDIVERQCDAIDEEINHKLPVPIYLGLMGTVMGIIIGLFSLKFQFNAETNALDGELFVESVSGLINGVKLAMICSFVGLGMTTLMSSWFYRGAKAELERQKNMFYDFIQTKLLPQMSRDAASTILTLQSNLEKFNSSFEDNIKGFGNIMDEIHQAFDSQVELQRKLERMDISKVANLNVNVLKQLGQSMTEFEKFTKYLHQMNTFVHSTAKLTDSINDQLLRTEAVETITTAMQDNIQKNKLVMEKLRAFLERVNENEAIITAAGAIDSAMTEAIAQLRNHAEEQIKSIKTYTTEATEDLQDLVKSERGHLRSLDQLGKLENLEKLVAAINSMKEDSHATTAKLESKIESLTRAVTDNSSAQRGESGIPSWLKAACMVLFIVTCFTIMFVSVKAVKAGVLASPLENGQMQMDSDSLTADTLAIDTLAVDTDIADTTAVIF